MVPEKDFNEVVRRLRKQGVPLPTTITPETFVQDLRVVLHQMQADRANGDDIPDEIESAGGGQFSTDDEEIDDHDAICVVDLQTSENPYLRSLMRK